jgi:hypothetical protein
VRKWTWLSSSRRARLPKARANPGKRKLEHG